MNIFPPQPGSIWHPMLRDITKHSIGIELSIASGVPTPIAVAFWVYAFDESPTQMESLSNAALAVISTKLSDKFLLGPIINKMEGVDGIMGVATRKTFKKLVNRGIKRLVTTIDEIIKGQVENTAREGIEYLQDRSTNASLIASTGFFKSKPVNQSTWHPPMKLSEKADVDDIENETTNDFVGELPYELRR